MKIFMGAKPAQPVLSLRKISPDAIPNPSLHAREKTGGLGAG